MNAEEFTLTLHFVSCRLPSWLSSQITEDLLPRQQAIFKTEPYVEDAEIVGVQFNVKNPLKVAENLRHTNPSEVKVSNLGKSGFYLYLPLDDCKHYRPSKNEDVKVRCSFKDDWLKLYYLPQWRQYLLESAF